RFFNPASVPMIANRKLLPSRPVKICTRNKIAFPLENHMAVFKMRERGIRKRELMALDPSLTHRVTIKSTAR
ncbi:hypothetical protein, partial [Neorhodopirellula pilleata]|uniref:hypothetical protein n=1 Tax=Neorhodopirellula pilleata TaxID=2714738 RepID=UPI001E291842